MNQPVVRAGFFRQLARRDLRVADLNEQAFRRVEEGLFGLAAGG
jgi:hypothetical protein